MHKNNLLSYIEDVPGVKPGVRPGVLDLNFVPPLRGVDLGELLKLLLRSSAMLAGPPESSGE